MLSEFRLAERQPFADRFKHKLLFGPRDTAQESIEVFVRTMAVQLVPMQTAGEIEEVSIHLPPSSRFIVS